MTAEFKVDNEFLSNLKNNIERMPKHHQVEVLRILKSHKSAKLNDNKNGVFVNIAFLTKEVLIELNNYVKYVHDQESTINNIEHQKQEFKNTFFSD